MKSVTFIKTLALTALLFSLHTPVNAHAETYISKDRVFSFIYPNSWVIVPSRIGEDPLFQSHIEIQSSNPEYQTNCTAKTQYNKSFEGITILYFKDHGDIISQQKKIGEQTWHSYEMLSSSFEKTVANNDYLYITEKFQIKAISSTRNSLGFWGYLISPKKGKIVHLGCTVVTAYTDGNSIYQIDPAVLRNAVREINEIISSAILLP